MASTITIKPVTVEIDGLAQNSKTLNQSADILGVGHGGDLLSKALVEVLYYINSDGQVPKGTTADLINDLERCIDITVGEAIRDITVRGEVLKRQLSDKMNRQERLTNMLSKVYYIKGIAMLGKSNDFEGHILSDIDEIEGKDKLVDELSSVLQEWIEEDGIEGVYSDDLTLHVFKKL